MSTNGGGASYPLTKRGKGRPRKIHTVGSWQASIPNGDNTMTTRPPWSPEVISQHQRDAWEAKKGSRSNVNEYLERAWEAEKGPTITSRFFSNWVQKIKNAGSKGSREKEPIILYTPLKLDMCTWITIWVSWWWMLSLWVFLLNPPLICSPCHVLPLIHLQSWWSTPIAPSVSFP